MPSPTRASEFMSLADDPLAGLPYRAIRLLGAGGMGEVFLAEHRQLATPCVVKIQHARLGRDPGIADRIRLEAEALARLHHPNIVSIISSGQTLDDRPFIVMEYLRGQTMADELAARGQLPLLEALSYACQLLRGLSAAHAAGIVHRDIKPDNLFLCDGARGERGDRVLKLLDFGVACTMPDALPLTPDPLAVPTATGTVVGALRYVSPEGALARRVDHRADLYSAALVLYFALAGRGPFDHIQSALLLLSAHVAEEPEPPSRFSKTPLPAELDQAVLRALRKAPDERFQSADELRQELERIMNQLRHSSDASEFCPLPEADASDPDSSGARIRTSKPVASADAALEQAGPLRLGSRFLDKYAIRQQIGRGGQAWVYHGQHIFTGREVAIKIVHSPRGITRETLERGRAEARALGKLEHPNIVVMHDAGVTDDGSFYIVMELLRGRSLRAALRAHGRFGIEEVLQLSTQAAEAVQTAHEFNVIHRDLTPDNIFLTRENRVKVLDFGIAKVLNEIGFTTHKDIVMGSVLYMSPEQVQGLQLTPRSDICALGLMMFEMLIGKHPTLLLFERDLHARNEPCRRPILAEIPPIQMNRTPPLLSQLDPQIPLELAQVVQRAMAKDPEDRFATMRDFVSALRACRAQSLTLERASIRDLSHHMAGESEAPPDSQRATPKRGLIWDGTGSLTPVPPAVEWPELTTAITDTASAPDLAQPSSRRGAASSWHARALPRTALILACLSGVALGSLGALRHFDAEKRVASRAPGELGSVGATSTTSNSLVASLSPAAPESERAPLPAPEQAAASAVQADTRAESPPAPPVHLVRRSAPATHATRKLAIASAAAPAPARPPEKMTDVSRPLEFDLDDKPRKDSPASSEVPRKKLNGGKAIYGD
jgi:serine/threonine-protein kinase